MGIAIQKVDNLAYWLDRLNSQIASMNISVKDPSIGAKGDGVSVTDGAITSGQATLTSVSRPATSSDVGKTVLVVGAGAAYNNLGAYVAGTAYAMGDYVTYGGSSWTVQTPISANSETYFNEHEWSLVYTTTRALYTTVASVSAGTYVLADAASTTVTGATVYIASDDSTPFQNAIDAAYNAGGGTVYVPSGMYTLAGVYVKSNVTVRFEPGTVLRQTPTSSSALFYVRNSNASQQCIGASVVGPQWTIDATGMDPVKGAGTITTRSVVGVYVQGAANYTIEGAKGVNFPLGNIVQNENTTGGLRPSWGNIGHLIMVNGPVGYGAVQVDDAYHLNIYDIWSDYSYCVNIEPDNPSSGPSRICEHISVRDCTVDTAYSSRIQTECVQCSAHNQTVRNVQFRNIRAIGGPFGIRFGRDLGTATGSVDNILVDGIYVVGGGRLSSLGTNMPYRSIIFRNFWCDGTNQINASNGLPLSAAEFSGGVTYDTGTIQNCTGHGMTSAYWDGSVWPSLADNTAVLRNVRIYGTGTAGNGTTYYGVYNQYTPIVRVIGCDIYDNYGPDQLPAQLRDAQINGSESWGGYQLTSRSRVPVAGIAATGTITSNNTNVSDGNTVTIGNITYRFKNTPAQAYDVQIGADANTSMNSLRNAIVQAGVPGTNYYTGTKANPDVTATYSNSTHILTLTAVAPGPNGNVALSKSASTLTVSNATLTGGIAPLVGVNNPAVLITPDGTHTSALITSPFPAGGNQYMIPVTAGTWVRWSGYIASANNTADNLVAMGLRTAQASIVFYDSNSNVVSGGGAGQGTTMAQGRWTYNYVLKQVPVGATYANITFGVNVSAYQSNGNDSSGEQYYVVPGEFCAVATSSAGTLQIHQGISTAQGTRVYVDNTRIEAGTTSSTTATTLASTRFAGAGSFVETNAADPQGVIPSLSQAQSNASYQRWVKTTITYRDIANLDTNPVAALTNSVLVLNLPVKGIVHGCYIVVTTAFAGTTTLTCTVGTAGSNAAFLASTDLKTTGTTNGVTGLALTPQSSVGSTPILLYATATGSNVSALSAGSVDVYVLTSQSP